MLGPAVEPPANEQLAAPLVRRPDDGSCGLARIGAAFRLIVCTGCALDDGVTSGAGEGPRPLTWARRCERSTLIAGAHISVADFEHSNWADFTVTPTLGSDHNLVRAVAGGVVSTMREIYNVVD